MKTGKTVVPGTLTCRQVEQFLLDYLEGNVTLWTWCKFRYHLFLCDDCRQYLQDYRNAVALGRRIFVNPEDEAAGKVPDEILAAILKAREQP
ncbi:MAG: hypothetical protein ACRESK_01125 [Gammaproteobacteria bacterium]